MPNALATIETENAEQVEVAAAKGCSDGPLYRVGTLVYTRRGLASVFFWMLWGDLFLNIMEAAFPAPMPLQLKWQKASDPVIGLLSNSIPFAVGVMLCPFIGLQSDRHRSPFGRRRPFLLWSTPCVALVLSLLGFAEPMSRAIHHTFGASPQTTTIVLLGVFATGFIFFNMYTMQVYQYLFVDVIPRQFMGRFIGMYRAIGVLAGFVFNRWMYGLAGTHLWQIYVTCAVLYCFAFMLLVWRVKEGEYPPPDAERGQLGLAASIKLYLRECYSNRFYLKFYAIGLFFWCGTVPLWTFVTFYVTDAGAQSHEANLGMSLDAFGKVKGWANLLQLPIFLLLGPLVDRFRPIRVLGIGLFATAMISAASFFLVHTPETFLIWWLIYSAAVAVVLCSTPPTSAMLLPREQFGQFASANQVFFSAGLIFAPVVCGWFLERIGNHKYVYLWSAAFLVLSAISAVSVYAEWRRRGEAES